MREILLAFILAGIGLQTSADAEQREKDSDVKYEGPVVYTNLPPPVLYFPNFPEKPKFSNRGSSGDTEDKRVEYVPFPYKDLPVLVYQSENQPPVHVVENNSNQNSEKDGHRPSQQITGYQTGPAIYREAENDRYDSDKAESTNHPQVVLPNFPLASSQIPSMDTTNRQFISIGLTSIQPQTGDQPESLHSDSSQQSNSIYNPYSAGQNEDQADYSNQNNEPLSESGSAYVSQYFSAQYPDQNSETQSQGQVELIRQAIQNYLVQQQSVHQQAQSGIQQALISYPGKQDSYASPSERTQHVGITIIRQPPASESSENESSEPQYAPPPPRYSPVPISSNQGYDDNQQFVSIGVFPVNVPGNDYGQDSQQYYNLLTPVSNDQYQSANDDYRQTSQNYEKPPVTQNYERSPVTQNYERSPVTQNYERPSGTQNDNSQPAGYQVISIDLSALKNQNADQERNIYSDYSQQVQSQPSNPPPQIYRPPPPPPPPNDKEENTYNGREKEVQQILIQIPQNIISKTAEKSSRVRGPYETPYTGTAQVAHPLDTHKASSRPSVNIVPTYSRPHPQRQPPKPYYSERPRSPPNEGFGFPQNGLTNGGINIAIIKQTESTNKIPAYKPPVIRPPPPSHNSQIRVPTHPIINRIPPPPNFSTGSRRPLYDNRPSTSNNVRLNYGRNARPYENSYSMMTMRYPPHQNFGHYKNKPLVPNFGGHPGIYASSNNYYTSVNPSVMKSPNYNDAFSLHSPTTNAFASATKDHAQFVPNPVSVPAAPLSAVSESQAINAFTNNIHNAAFGEINFDEINSFLSPNYDLFGSMTNGPDKKKVEKETKFLQAVSSDLLTHDINAIGLAGAIPSYNMVKQPPRNIQNFPFPYKYWEQPLAHLGPQNMMYPSDRTKYMNPYSHMQHPHSSNRPFSLFRKGKGRKRGLGKGNRGLRRKLAEIRTSIRQKSKISSRQEIIGEENNTPGQMSDSSVYEIAAPRSTIIKTNGPGLDGITIPLNPEHVLSSRISTEDDESEKGDMPPIIVYKGYKPPIEVYGSKEDIEQKSNETTPKVDIDNYDSTEVPSKSPSDEPSEVLISQETAQAFSSIEGSGYLDYMYSMLPELIKNSFGRREDSDESKWSPVSSIKYAVAEDHNDTNETTTEKVTSPIELETFTDFLAALNSSTNAEPNIKENVEEKFSLMGKEEKSDLVKE